MNQASLREEYSRLLARLRSDDRVVGVVLTGSQARAGTASRWSDYDLRVVTDDRHRADVDAATRRAAGLDVVVMSWSEFCAHALPGTDAAWDRYSFVHARVLKDTESQVADLVAQKGTLSEDEGSALAPRLLDQFINSIYRSLKNQRDGRVRAGRLDAAESIRPLVGYLFALDRRVEPYNSYLEWELSTFPLLVPGWDVGAVRAVVDGLLDPDRTVAGARRAYAAVEETAARYRHLHVVDGWSEEALALLRGPS